MELQDVLQPPAGMVAGQIQTNCRPGLLTGRSVQEASI